MIRETMICPRFAQPETQAHRYSSAIAVAANAMANAIVSTHTINHMKCPQTLIVERGGRLGQIRTGGRCFYDLEMSFGY
jgi:hypothetical protein